MSSEAVVSAKSLQVTRQLAGLVLQREREAGEGSRPNSACGVSSQLEASCRSIPAEDLLAAIRRHRLETLLAADPLVLQLIPLLADRLKVLARKEQMEALALASLTREMAALFERAGIPMLVIKGVPLALQTTGLLAARGRGDCDLFVDPADLGEATTLLKSVGFVLCETNGARGIGSDGIYGHYSRFVSIEISLKRVVGGKWQWIDLHWHVTHARDVLPGFQILWKRLDELSINGQTIFTLNHTDALLHSCCHAAMDRWMSIRSLIDIERLTRGFSEIELHRLQRQRLVRKSFAVLEDCNLLADSVKFSKYPAFRVSDRHVINDARKTQLMACRTDESLLNFGLRHLRLSYSPINWLVKLLLMLAPPDVLFHPSTGSPLSLPQVAVRRIRKLSQQVMIWGNASQRFHR
ncbi:nucleotidyltransferase family protein [Synechococcus sp. SYN20]|uniref:nucleotidyltransferase family protein n=1 Tax=Synechococcus sp. SYN20 TaxID=1050714 RepID=UPI0016459D78|nr:nucleotidyltransferase family protein [Synechococcus sp. SYN20]